jgi:hypothetical protein
LVNQSQAVLDVFDPVRQRRVPRFA